MIANGTLDRIIVRLGGWVGGWSARSVSRAAIWNWRLYGRQTAVSIALCDPVCKCQLDGCLFEYNDPPPDAVWLPDITGNNDDEVVVLRRVPAEVGAPASVCA